MKHARATLLVHFPDVWAKPRENQVIREDMEKDAVLMAEWERLKLDKVTMFHKYNKLRLERRNDEKAALAAERAAAAEEAGAAAEQQDEQLAGGGAARGQQPHAHPGAGAPAATAADQTRQQQGRRQVLNSHRWPLL